MKRTLILFILGIFFVVALASGPLGSIIPGGGFFQSPVAHIQLPAETVFKLPLIFTDYSVTNTSISLWIAIFLLIFVSFLGTRKLKDIPGRLQNFLEIIVEFFLNLVESVSGSKIGRKFLPLVMTIFLCVITSNWLGILPGVGTIGLVETAEVLCEHKSHHLHHSDDHGDDHHNSSKCTDDVIKEIGDEKLTPFKGSGFLKIIVPGTKDEETKALSTVIGDSNTGRLLPIIRGASTDLNTSLAIGIVAMIFVQIWGFQALGIKGYGSKFISFKSPIMFFVGLLELIAEIARVISFTFRLFGNMFAGEVLLVAMAFLIPLIGIIPFMGLELFVGLIQAFIFAMLTLVFGVSAIADHNEH
ncbi:MAG: hypothetical protein CL764_07290 [Chloroflexi bacterium]|nr:hypothetical protein [Chloroflexota bacterium]|tara:strand:- start:19988 stop:21061 length:1074 start_codon:yes stop_codon:yes gene_type:complete